MKRKYSWIPDLPDHRDLVLPLKVMHLPDKIDLSPSMPPCYDQGQLGSCTGNGTAAAIEFDQIKQQLTRFTPSRLFIYYWERSIEGTIKQDSGAQIRDAIKAISKYGAPPESQWPYSDDAKTFKKKPSTAVCKIAKDHLAVKYQRVQQNGIKEALASGYPVIIGFTVYDSFESDAVAKTGRVPMPSPTENVLGGHCVLAMGYTADGYVLCRNSWGTTWGMQGYFLIPYQYLSNPDLASDFWVVEQIK